MLNIFDQCLKNEITATTFTNYNLLIQYKQVLQTEAPRVSKSHITHF